MRKVILSFLLVLMSGFSIFGVTSAVFEESVKVAGASFTVTSGTSTGGGGTGETGNVALKIFVNNSGSAQGANLSDSVNGPVFGNISPDWVEVFPIKLHNKASAKAKIVSSANYVSDPNTLRDDIFIEILAWNDSNSNGSIDEGELGESYKRDTILRLRNDTFLLGEIEAGSTKGFALRFDGSGVSAANVGHTAIYDFIFTGIEVIE